MKGLWVETSKRGIANLNYVIELSYYGVDKEGLETEKSDEIVAYLVSCSCVDNSDYDLGYLLEEVDVIDFFEYVRNEDREDLDAMIFRQFDEIKFILHQEK